ncbi:MAG: sigma-54-dependent Fis family transcriptional regulator [Deltaproteobacteria bacterium]|nr:MAG: sigma-54-dependent Fis family transcriptional regulator [Deltaproteobacteria bacterium]
MPAHLTPKPVPAPRILVVDDEVEHAATLARVLRREGIEVEAVHGVPEAIMRLNQAAFDAVLTDLLMPGQDGLDLLRAIRELDLDLWVVVMTAFGNVERAVEAMKAGARDFLVKPVRRAHVLEALRPAIERRRLRHENANLRQELQRLQSESPIVGDSPALRQALGLLRQAAASDATVLLLGESGTGKELFARELHARSPRRDGPFVPLHCAALPESIIESELFGHEAGAFTGAQGQRAGRFETAHGGTLFLDEIGELGLAVQVKLLRVLQEGEITRVGGSTPRPVDVRIVAATHRDLQQEVRSGRFREDLFYRLHVIPIGIPPLRDRAADVPLLATHFIQRCAERNGLPVPTLTTSARRWLAAAPWPGNVRELENTLERAVILDQDGRVDLDDLPLVPAPPETPGEDTGDDPRPMLRIPVGTPLAEVERQLLLATLDHTRGDKSQAAQLLGVGRRTVYRRLEEYENQTPALEPDEPPEPEDGG